MTIHHTFTRDEIADLRAINGDEITRAIHRIAGDAAKRAGMTLARLIGPDRSAAAVRVRDVAISAARREGYSMPQIGKAMNRDHTTVLASIRRQQARRGEA